MPLFFVLAALGVGAYFLFHAGKGNAPPPFTIVTLFGGPQAIGAPAGKLVQVNVPPGASLVSLSPAQGVPPSGVVASIKDGVGQLVIDPLGTVAAGTPWPINILWRAPDGSPQATVLTITELAPNAPAGAAASAAAAAASASLSPTDQKFLALAQAAKGSALLPAEIAVLLTTPDPATGLAWNTLTETAKQAGLAALASRIAAMKAQIAPAPAAAAPAAAADTPPAPHA